MNYSTVGSKMKTMVATLLTLFALTSAQPIERKYDPTPDKRYIVRRAGFYHPLPTAKVFERHDKEEHDM